MDEAVVLAYGECIRCTRVFAFDPDLVASVWVHEKTHCSICPDGAKATGQDGTYRAPLCRACESVIRRSVAVPLPVRELFPHARLDLIVLPGSEDTS